ncbi:MAG: HPr family phosphocarrier protein [Clostridiaceae bacterium]|jgi:phosphocarrier protein HPr|nr:HPr family phosphocarrier protein [Clostridiaceae bacterium]
MISKEIVIKNASGLESKVAARLIQKASGYESNIWIQKGDRKANAKSLLGILSLSVSKGEKVLLIADGSDEQIALQDLVNFAEREMSDQ